MARFLPLFAVLMLVLGASGSAQAKAKSTTGKKPVGVEGVVVRVVKAKITISAGDGSPDRAIVLAVNTKYTKGGQEITFADLAEGQHVTITVKGNVATAIAVD